MRRFKITQEIHFCYGHRLPDYPGKCVHLHGHNGVLEVDVESDTLDALGMVVDFHRIREVVEAWVDEHLDHKMILCERDPIAAALRELGQPVFSMADNPTAENIAKLVYDAARDRGLPVSEVRLWETASACARYRAD